MVRPTMFYYVLLRTKDGNTGKVISSCTADELQCVAVVRPHTNDLKSAIDKLKGSGKYSTGKRYVYEEDLMSVSELEQLTGKQIRLKQITDVSVLGGVRVELEGRQLDGTVRGRLSGISRKLNEVMV